MKRYLTISQVSEMLTLSKPTIYRKIAEQSIPYVRVGSRIFFDPDVIDLWIREHSVGIPIKS